MINFALTEALQCNAGCTADYIDNTRFSGALRSSQLSQTGQACYILDPRYLNMYGLKDTY